MKNEIVLASGREDYCTPGVVLDAVRQVAPIGLDPCAHPRSIVNAWHSFYGPTFRHVDGLAHPWSFIRPPTLVYANPPYGRSLHRWLEKAVIEAAKGVQIIMLVPARVSTKYWRNYVWPTKQRVCFWNGGYELQGRTRLRFLDPLTGVLTDSGATFDAALVYWGSRVDRFDRAFRQHGELV